MRVVIDKDELSKAVDSLLNSIETGNLKAGDFAYKSFSDETGLHEAYEIEPDNDPQKRAILIIKDPVFLAIHAFIGTVPVLIYMDKESECIPVLWDRIKLLKEQA